MPDSVNGARLILPRALIDRVTEAMRASILRHRAAPAPESRALGESLERQFLALVEGVARFDALYGLWGWDLEPKAVASALPEPAVTPPDQTLAVEPIRSGAHGEAKE